MNKLLLLILTFLVIHSIIWAQSCLPDGIAFTTQTQIDSFQINYPGCTEIEGDVHIHGADIINLSGLNVLTQINGNLTIDSTNLTNLQGLNSLKSINRGLYLSFNNHLNHLMGLDSLTMVNSSIVVSFSPLYDFAGATQLTNIGGLTLYYAGIKSLSGLEGLTIISGDLFINHCHDLNSLSGLEAVTNIYGHIFIDSCSALSSLSGLKNVSSINGIIQIVFTGIKSLSGLDNIDYQSIHYLIIVLNDSLSECEVESVCEYIADPTGGISLGSNAPGCDSIAEVKEACETFDISNIEYREEYWVYPNPAEEEFVVGGWWLVEGPWAIEVFDLFGRQVIEKVVPESQNEMIIDCENWRKGFYLVHIKNKTGTQQIEKLIIR